MSLVGSLYSILEVLKSRGILKSPKALILKWSNDLDDLGVPSF